MIFQLAELFLYYSNCLRVVLGNELGELMMGILHNRMINAARRVEVIYNTCGF